MDQWLKAGQYAAARLAHIEAISHFERGLATLAVLPESQARDRQEIELQLARGLSLFTAKGFEVSEAAQAYTRARELAERQGDADKLSVAIYGLWQANIGSGTLAGAHVLSNRLLQLTSSATDDGLRLQAHHTAWTTCLFAGEPEAAREHCEAGPPTLRSRATPYPPPTLWRARSWCLRGIHGCASPLATWLSG